MVGKLVETPGDAFRQPDKKSGGPGLQVIHASMMRMGTASISRAYRRLGLRTHHGLDDVLWGNPWLEHERAAESTWPDATSRLPPGPLTTGQPWPPAPFARADWDRMWGDDYDVATDMASPYTLELIRAYPEARVVVVQRDFEAWWPSFERVCMLDLYTKPVWLRSARDWFTWHVIGNRCIHAMYKVWLGFLDVEGEDGMTKERVRRVYDEFYEAVRREVPEERRLEYDVKDGWEPLARFLGKEVPDIPFPRLNDRAAKAEMQSEFYWYWFVVFPMKMGLGAAALALVPYLAITWAGYEVSLPKW